MLNEGGMMLSLVASNSKQCPELAIDLWHSVETLGYKAGMQEVCGPKSESGRVIFLDHLTFSPFSSFSEVVLSSIALGGCAVVLQLMRGKLT